jgi:predicted nucleotidyltransferase
MNLSQTSLGALFGSQGLEEVMALLVLNEEQEYYQREIASRTDLRLLQVQHALRRIEKAGFAVSRRRGNRIYYKANVDHPAFGELRSLLVKTVGVGARLKAALEPLESRITLAFVFGSFATNTQIASSDVDLAVIGEVGLRELSPLLTAVERELGREVNAVVFMPDEFRHRSSTGEHFVDTLLKEPKIWLIGDEDELRSLAD